MCDQSGVIEADETSSRNRNLQRTAEKDLVEEDKTSPLERISGRKCEQSEVIKVTSSHDQIWQRTVEQNLDDWIEHEPASRFFERIRERIGGSREGKILRFVAV